VLDEPSGEKRTVSTFTKTGCGLASHALWEAFPTIEGMGNSQVDSEAGTPEGDDVTEPE
jgi:hypothetical protein